MLKKIRWYVKPFQYNMREHDGWIGTQTDGLNCYTNIRGFLKDFLEMHNPCLSHQSPRTWAVTRLHKVFKKRRCRITVKPKNRPGTARAHKNCPSYHCAVDFEQFSLYSYCIGTMVVQGALSWLPVSFSLHVKYTGIVLYVVSYRSIFVSPPVRHVPLF